MNAPEPKTGPDRLVCFRIAGQEFGLAIESVKETLTMRPLTRVFLTPSWVLGIINLRGDVVAILDLSQLLGMEAVDVTSSSRIVIVRHGTKLAGLIVDELSELRRIDLDAIDEPPSTLTEQAVEIIAGLATLEEGSALRILDLEALFASDRMTSLARTRE